MKKCEFRKMLLFLGKKYSLTLLYVMSDEPIRYNQLFSLFKSNINPTLLSRRLKTMQELRLIKRIIVDNTVFYVQTKNAKSLKNTLDLLKKLMAQENYFVPAICRNVNSRCTCDLLKKA
ncbi:MAG: winged helix-turn-helix transcriptional regulator [archaeon]